MLAIGLSFISGLGIGAAAVVAVTVAGRGHAAARGARLRRHQHRQAAGCRGCTTTATARARRSGTAGAGSCSATRGALTDRRPRDRARARRCRCCRCGSASSTPATTRPARRPRQAYDLLAKGFGPGFNGPFLLAIQLPARRRPHRRCSTKLHDGARGHAGRRVGLARDHEPVGNDRGHAREPDDRAARRGHEPAVAPPAPRRDPASDRGHRRRRSTSAASARSPTTSPTCSANDSRCSSRW